MVSRTRITVLLLLSSVVITGASGWAQGAAGQEQVQAAVKNPPPAAVPMIDQRALDVLKNMSDTIIQAKTMGFQSRSMIPIKGPNGIWINLFGVSRVMVQGQNKLFAETRGDFFPYDFYFDGTTVTAYAPTKNVYAQKEAPGTVEELTDRAYREEGRTFPYADILTSNPYEKLTSGLTKAIFVGRSTIAGVKTDHLAFSNEGVEWQIWVAEDDHLPRLVSARYLEDVSEPDYTIEFFNWKLNEPVPDANFVFQNTSNAAKVDFRKPDKTI
ncbi:MAG: DUF2092 domain-containing protein [Candidatus Omnitrophica bacterium]|nr:DUF2092 domain-containing protein [Candidatus Omnitrophota bacterium]